MANFTDKQRHLALQRALKMSMLFKEGTFDAIMTVLHMPSNVPNREAMFFAACPASLTTEEKEWLWNYLQRCTMHGSGGWLVIPDSGNTGW